MSWCNNWYDGTLSLASMWLNSNNSFPVFTFSVNQEGRLGGLAWHLDFKKWIMGLRICTFVFISSLLSDQMHRYCTFWRTLAGKTSKSRKFINHKRPLVDPFSQILRGRRLSVGSGLLWTFSDKTSRDAKLFIKSHLWGTLSGRTYRGQKLLFKSNL